MSNPNLSIVMDRDLASGIAYCLMLDGSEIKILVPDQMPPPGTTQVRMSIEDFGRLMGAASNYAGEPR